MTFSCIDRVRHQYGSLVRSACIFVVLLFGCSPEYIDATVLHFAVYSDAKLSRVTAVVLDQDERDTNLTKTFEILPGVRENTTYLFDMMVQRTSGSSSHPDAIVRFDGWLDTEFGPKYVIRRTVRAAFTERTALLARVWLANSCIDSDGDPTCPGGGFSCAYETETCQPHSGLLATQPVSAELDLRARWFPETGYRACGAPDDHCPANCSLHEDHDCKYEVGTTCAQDEQCKTNTCSRACAEEACPEKRCCESRCDEPCSFCATDGTCRRFDFSSDPRNCGSCGDSCSSNHGRAVCQDGQCIRMCDRGFDDCENGLRVDGCETDLSSNRNHCGSCSGAGAVCRYRVCEHGGCLGTKVPNATSTGASTLASGLFYLRRIVYSTTSIAAIGLHLMEAERGNVTFVIVDDEESRPGRILALSDAPAHGDEPGASYGTEVVFDAPIDVPADVFWIGFSISDVVSAKQIANGGTPEVYVVGASLPRLGMQVADLGDVVDVTGSLSIMPYLYLVHL